MNAFEGLFPEQYDGEVQDLIFVLSYFHGLIRSRMHTETTTANVDDSTAILGIEVRRFQRSICAAFPNTTETKGEASARMRRATAAAKKSGSSVPEGTGGVRKKAFNISTVKWHRMGHYADAIRRLGPMDNVDSRHVSLFT
jgi:hypothetical protein